jgi:hypothetical protein
MSHSVHLVKARSGKEIDAIAFNLIQAFQPDAVKIVIKFDVELFFDCELEKQTGIKPDYKPIGDGVDGYTDIERMECIICSELTECDEDDVKRRRLRATQAHEIGHCFLHVEELKRRGTMFRFLHNDQTSLERYKQEEIKAYLNPEWQAWRFAGALLMPECCFRAAVNNNWTKRKMSRAFDVNISFIDVRLRDLKIPNRVRHG